MSPAAPRPHAQRVTIREPLGKGVSPEQAIAQAPHGRLPTTGNNKSSGRALRNWLNPNSEVLPGNRR